MGQHRRQDPLNPEALSPELSSRGVSHQASAQVKYFSQNRIRSGQGFPEAPTAYTDSVHDGELTLTLVCGSCYHRKSMPGINQEFLGLGCGSM